MILNGKIIKEEKTKLLSNLEHSATLAIIVIGNHSASSVYVNNKLKYCDQVGVETRLYEYNEDVLESEILSKIDELNNDKSVDGLFVQLPVPKHINEIKIIDSINSKKDVDGFTKNNIGNLFLSNDGLYPATVEGIIDIINFYDLPIAGQTICIAGRSNIVGKPLALRLINLGATVISCNSKTKDIKSFIDLSDIFISAIGIPKFFTKDFFIDNPKISIIDVGMNRDVNNKLCGDVDFENVVNIVENITPVPGGVGLLTVCNVISNTIKAHNSND